jgi:glycerol-3-phosphate acyltransferase PlsY
VTPLLGVHIAISYLCGSIPFGLFIVRLVAKKDVREVGSGNIGATNVARAAGRTAAVVTMLLDALKGLVPVLIAVHHSVKLGSAWAGPLCAVAAVVGHCFPVWLLFRGGKGVATGFGVTLALSPWAALAGGATWGLVYKVFKISSLGSLLGVLVALIVGFLTGVPREALWGMGAVSLVIVLRHKANLERLLARQER